MKNTPARRGSTLFVVLAFALLMMPIAALAGPAVFEACVNPGNGNMVDATTVCHANETRVQWNDAGPQGPSGPAGPSGAAGPTGSQGPAGPAGTSAGGPPFIWVCTPANYTNAGSTNGALHVFNGGALTANVAVHFLNKNGLNLAGAVVPGTNPELRKGEQRGDFQTLARSAFPSGCGSEPRQITPPCAERTAHRGLMCRCGRCRRRSDRHGSCRGSG